jgi:NAD-dependent deacetylase
MLTELEIAQAAQMLRASRYPCALTGAGVSKESGIPTFRDALDGLWAQYDPRQLATPAAFQANPRLVWDFYEMRRAKMHTTEPNPGHRALAALDRRPAGLPIITQNIDDLHERAGSSTVIHLHGLLAQNRCSRSCQGLPTLIDVSSLMEEGEAVPPKCPYCGAWVRPDVVWFGEYLPPEALRRADQLLGETDLMLIIGTSGVVAPASQMPYAAKRHGAKLIEINPYESELTSLADLWLRAPSGEALPAILAMLDAQADQPS